MTRRAWEPPLFEWSIHKPVPVELTESLVDEEGKALAGLADCSARIITLDSGMADLETRVALMHEWLHLWAHDCGFEALMGVRNEEPWVQALASALVAREDFHAAGGVSEG